jgi:hypothetical protein
MEVAAEHPEAIGKGPGVGVEERLLLDRVALYAADIPPRHVQSAAPVVADFADAGLTFGNRAAMTAGVAANAIAIEFLVEVAFSHSLIHDFAKSWHAGP